MKTSKKNRVTLSDLGLIMRDNLRILCWRGWFLFWIIPLLIVEERI